MYKGVWMKIWEKGNYISMKYNFFRSVQLKKKAIKAFLSIISIEN